jgi:hypothetical protein
MKTLLIAALSLALVAPSITYAKGSRGHYTNGKGSSHKGGTYTTHKYLPRK